MKHFPARTDVLRALCLLMTAGLSGVAATTPEPIRDKTLVAWVSPANLTQRGGSVLTLDDGQSHFDGIVFGELQEKRWIAVRQK